MTHEIKIEYPGILSAVLKERLKVTLAGQPDITLTLRGSDENVRGIDPTVLVAIVAVADTTLGALITGLFKLMEKNKGETIKITGKTGRVVEISGKLTPEKLSQCVKVAKELDIDRIEIK